MKADIRLILSRIWIILGVLLVVLSCTGKIDEWWSGMGSALAAVGLLQMLRRHRLNKNEQYREKIEIEEKDERIRFIRNKAWAWTGYIMVIAGGLAVIVLRIMGQIMLSLAASYTVCFVVLVYWVSYMILQKKY